MTQFKTIIALSIICMLIGKNAIAQLPADNTIVYDFSRGAFETDNSLGNGKISPQPFGGFSIIKIKNVNTFLYKVEIQGRSINYVTPIPSELQTIFRLPVQENAKENATGGLNKAQEISAQTGKAKAQSDIKVNTINGQLVNQRNNIIGINADKVKINSNGKPVKSNKPALEKNEKAAAEVKNNIVNSSDDSTKAEVEQKVLSDLNLAAENFTSAVSVVTDFKLLRISLIDLVKHDWKNYGDMISHAPQNAYELSTMKAAIKRFNDTYAELQRQLANAGDISDGTVAGRLKKLAEEAYKNITENGFLQLIDDILVLQGAIDNDQCFTVVSPPIQMEGDFVAFNIKAVPVRTSDLQNFKFGKEFNIEIPTKGGWKTDFSVGPTISFGNNSRSDKYYTEAVAGKADSVTLRQRDNNNAISPGIAAMMHVYSRSGKNTSFGGMFGVGAGFQSIDNPNLSLYAGLTAVLGKREKIMVSSGVSYLSVDRIKNKQFEAGKVYGVQQSADATEKVIKPSFFLSVSYNLTRRIEVK